MDLSVYREAPDGLVRLGVLGEDRHEASFRYDADYLERPDAAPVSLSLPLREEPYAEAELAPYFRGLLPEGAALESLCLSLGIEPGDYFGMLAACGLDCLGDVVINPKAYAETRGYSPLSFDQVKGMSGKPAKIDHAIESARLSLAGTQSKCGLYHDPSASTEEGWFQPVGGAPSNVIVKFAREELSDLMLVEHLTMRCAAACGLPVARTFLMDANRPALCVERYDRLSPSEEVIDGIAAPRRRHQEDLAQAFGLLPDAKYRELEPNSDTAIASFIRDKSAKPTFDLRFFVQLVLFDYLVGNCDNHLKNMSILYANDWRSFSLAPAYDLASTAYYARFSREMGMAIGRHRLLDDVTPEDFLLFAERIGVSPRVLRSAISRFSSHALPSLREEGKRLEKAGFGSAPYVADDIEEDVAGRLAVLEAV